MKHELYALIMAFTVTAQGALADKLVCPGYDTGLGGSFNIGGQKVCISVYQLMSGAPGLVEVIADPTFFDGPRVVATIEGTGCYEKKDFSDTSMRTLSGPVVVTQSEERPDLSRWITTVRGTRVHPCSPVCHQVGPPDRQPPPDHYWTCVKRDWELGTRGLIYDDDGNPIPEPRIGFDRQE